MERKCGFVSARLPGVIGSGKQRDDDHRGDDVMDVLVDRDRLTDGVAQQDHPQTQQNPPTMS